MAHGQWQHVADTLREKFEKLATLMDTSRDAVVAGIKEAMAAARSASMRSSI